MKCEKTGRIYENFGGEKFQKWPWFLEKLAANSRHNLATLIKNKKVRKLKCTKPAPILRLQEETLLWTSFQAS